MFEVNKYINEFVAFLFFLVVFVWILRNGKQFNEVLSGLSTTYIKTFQGLTQGA